MALKASPIPTLNDFLVLNNAPFLFFFVFVSVILLTSQGLVQYFRVSFQKRNVFGNVAWH